MRARRIAASLAAAMTIAGGVAFASAPGASAVAPGNTLDGCTLSNQVNDGVGYTTVVYGPGCSPNMIVQGANAGQGPGIGVGSTALFSGPGNGASAVSGTASYWILYFTTGACDYTQYVYFTGTANVPSPSSTCETAAGQSPLPWLKAYGRSSANATCEPGWNPSYAEWPNGGTVCEQTLSYVGGTRQ